MSITTDITDFVASNLRIFAPAVALLVAWVLYGVLGKRFLGADDDFWPAIRRRVLPRLDAVARKSGLYAERESTINRYAGKFWARSLDDFERDLEAMGYHRNPLASYKHYRHDSGEIWQSDGSWAKRYGVIRGLGDALHAANVDRTGTDRWLGGGFLGVALGRFLASLGDILATRQVHLTLYVDPDDDGKGGDTVIHVFAHAEANSLNPVTAFAHYAMPTQSAKEGIRRFRADVKTQPTGPGIGHRLAKEPDSAAVSPETHPSE